MDLLLNIAISLIGAVVVFAGAVYGFKRGWLKFDAPDNTDLRMEVKRLEFLVGGQQADISRLNILLESTIKERNKLLEEMSELYRQIRGLQGNEILLTARIKELEAVKKPKLPTVPLLLVCGDAAFCEQDKSQLRRARVQFRELAKATRDLLEDELNRRRENDRMFPWMHISAHGSLDGILLEDGIVAPHWFNEQLTGIKVLFAANCDSIEVGDALVGVVDHVVVFYGKRDSEDIARFTYNFWSEMIKLNDPLAAYDIACTRVPQIQPFVDLRTA